MAQYDKDVSAIEGLKTRLKDWEWRRNICNLPTEIKQLDLSTKEGLMRPFQIEMSKTRSRGRLKHLKDYPHPDHERRQAELNQANSDYERDLNDPAQVGNGQVADAILNRMQNS